MPGGMSGGSRNASAGGRSGVGASSSRSTSSSSSSRSGTGARGPTGPNGESRSTPGGNGKGPSTAGGRQSPSAARSAPSRPSGGGLRGPTGPNGESRSAPSRAGSSFGASRSPTSSPQRNTSTAYRGVNTSQADRLQSAIDRNARAIGSYGSTPAGRAQSSFDSSYGPQRPTNRSEVRMGINTSQADRLQAAIDRNARAIGSYGSVPASRPRSAYSGSYGPQQPARGIPGGQGVMATNGDHDVAFGGPPPARNSSIARMGVNLSSADVAADAASRIGSYGSVPPPRGPAKIQDRAPTSLAGQYAMYSNPDVGHYNSTGMTTPPNIGSVIGGNPDGLQPYNTAHSPGYAGNVVDGRQVAEGYNPLSSIRPPSPTSPSQMASSGYDPLGSISAPTRSSDVASNDDGDIPSPDNNWGAGWESTPDNANRPSSPPAVGPTASSPSSLSPPSPSDESDDSGWSPTNMWNGIKDAASGAVDTAAGAAGALSSLFGGNVSSANAGTGGSDNPNGGSLLAGGDKIIGAIAEALAPAVSSANPSVPTGATPPSTGTTTQTPPKIFTPPSNYFTYGFGPEWQMFSNNDIA